ncbi:AAA family ATPase [Parabacteroides sp. PF5-9]|uniref:AAA family ATPase n=1 Tax=Parabacteroides sp. PF5-9 TaxID=1742404 RepID=UPI002475F1DD|nr:AAA family ATPase [Parabacteroides sp. PF5-9]MDH6357796.1 ATP-dependent protease Clp ATPase subunit [Parabacteroides sp. PF5-9]
MEAKNVDKRFVNKIVTNLTETGYKVLTDLPIVQCNLSFIATAPDEILMLGEILPTDFIEADIEKSINKLNAIRMSITNLFADTLEDIEINISMVIVSSRKIKLSNKIKNSLFYSNIELLLFGKNSKNVFPSLPKIDSDLLADKDLTADFDAYFEYIETVISYLTSSPVTLTRNIFDDNFINNFDSEFVEKIKVEASMTLLRFNSARSLAEEVKKYVKGQDEVIEKVSVPFFQHIQSRARSTSGKIKNSFLLIGNTGVGKSEILRQFAKIVDVPVIRINLPNCTPEGWRGNNISKEISLHIRKEEDIERLRYAVIIFNEFDKIAHRTDSETSEFRAEIQKQLLQFFDEDYKLSVRINSNDPNSFFKEYELPVNDFLICFDGAFKGIEEHVGKRLRCEGKISYGQIGFQAAAETSKMKDCSYDSLMRYITKQDVEKFGIISELCGRIEQVVLMNQMTEELIYEIITEADDSIVKHHRLQCEQLGVKLNITEDAFRKIASMVQKSGLGIRAVKPIFSNLMEKVYFDHEPYSGKTLTIDAEFIEIDMFRNSNRNLINDYKKMQKQIIDKEQFLKRNALSEEELLDKIYFLEKSM